MSMKSMKLLAAASLLGLCMQARPASAVPSDVTELTNGATFSTSTGLSTYQESINFTTTTPAGSALGTSGDSYLLPTNQYASQGLTFSGAPVYLRNTDGNNNGPDGFSGEFIANHVNPDNSPMTPPDTGAVTLNFGPTDNVAFSYLSVLQSTAPASFDLTFGIVGGGSQTIDDVSGTGNYVGFTSTQAFDSITFVPVGGTSGNEDLFIIDNLQLDAPEVDAHTAALPFALFTGFMLLLADRRRKSLLS
jgi:hypothetical protein